MYFSTHLPTKALRVGNKGVYACPCINLKTDQSILLRHAKPQLKIYQGFFRKKKLQSKRSTKSMKHIQLFNKKYINKLFHYFITNAVLFIIYLNNLNLNITCPITHYFLQFSTMNRFH